MPYIMKLLDLVTIMSAMLVIVRPVMNNEQEELADYVSGSVRCNSRQGEQTSNNYCAWQPGV